MVTQRELPVKSQAESAARPTWTFLTNHPVILIFIVQHPESTVRTVAQGVGLTERATLAILRDLDDEGLVERHRNGRRNTYAINYGRLLGLSAGTELDPAVNGIVAALISISPEAGKARQEYTPSKHDERPRVGTWEFFTNHTLMLAAIARDNTLTVRELAARVGVTERAAVSILHQLEAEGIITRHKEGRRNSYSIDIEAYRHFRGWEYDGWALPKALVDMAVFAIQAIGRMAQARS